MAEVDVSLGEQDLQLIAMLRQATLLGWLDAVEQYAPDDTAHGISLMCTVACGALAKAYGAMFDISPSAPAHAKEALIDGVVANLRERLRHEAGLTDTGRAH